MKLKKKTNLNVSFLKVHFIEELTRILQISTVLLFILKCINWKLISSFIQVSRKSHFSHKVDKQDIFLNMYSAPRATAYCELLQKLHFLTEIHTSPTREADMYAFTKIKLSTLLHIKRHSTCEHYLLVCVSETFIVIKKENEKNRERGRKSNSGYDVDGFRHSDWMRRLFFSHLQHRSLFKIGFISVSTVSKP